MIVIYDDGGKIKSKFSGNKAKNRNNDLYIDGRKVVQNFKKNFKVVPNQKIPKDETGELDATLNDIETFSLEEVRTRKLEEIRQKANRIITDKWPVWRQQNCNAGIYPSAEKDQKDQDIADVITASNNAEDEVTTATTISEIEAIKPNWPTI